ncbi:MAG: Internalin-A precursor [Actinomycetota bacterium]|jgi:uncharacterized repeat protein (TIGR02543 family)
MNLRKFAATAAVASLLALGAASPSALATPTVIALDGASTFSTWACEPTNLGFGNLNFTTLEFTQGSGTNNVCEATTGYASSAFNPLDGYVYSTDLYDPVISRVDVRGNPVFFSGGRTLPVTGFNGVSLKLAINPRTGDAYIVEGSTLRTMSLTTGSSTSEPISLGFDVRAMAYSPSGQLYGFDNVGNLKRIDPTTGATTDVTYMANKCDNNRPKSMAFDAAGTLIFVDGGGVLCSAKVTNFDGTVAKYTSSVVADYDHIWVGAPANEYVGAPIVVTYGNLRINFDVNGGDALTPAYSPFYPQSILNQLGQTNATIRLPRPTRSGYTFNGWFDAATDGTKIGDAGDSYTPSSEVGIEMYAQWTEQNLANTGSRSDVLFLAGAMLVSLGAGVAIFSRRLKG